MSLLRISRSHPIYSYAPPLSSSLFRLSPSRLAAGFHTSPKLNVLREHDRNRDGVDNEYESHKQDQLKRHKEGQRPSWTETLASTSEADVKADRGEQQSPEEVAAMEREIKKGKSTSSKEQFVGRK